MNQTRINNHYHLLNIIKLLSIIAIIVLHTNEFIFFEDIYPLADKTIIYPAFLFFARFIPFSGQTIVSLVFFIWGLKQTSFSSLKKVLPILILGQVLITMSFLEGRSFFEAWEWDIYCFLFVALLCLKFIQNLSRRSFKILMIFSATLFALSPWVKATSFGNNMFTEIFIGRCAWGKTGSWPLFPWIGLPLFSYSFARLLKEKGAELSLKETLIWFLLLILTPLSWGELFDTPIGPQFYCFMFNQSQLIFWGNFLMVFFLMRVSLLDRVQIKLDQIELVRFLSRLHWSRHLGLCYLTQIMILCLFSDWGSFFQQHPVLFDLFFLAIFPSTEIFVSGFFRLQKVFISKQKN